MTTLETYNSPQPAAYEDRAQAFDLSYFIDLLKRRFLYFLIPFSLLATLGFVVVAMQRPIYRAEGQVIVESPEIPPDLVRPTITQLADERVAVLKQRIMAKDNLFAVAHKFNLFPHERATLSPTVFIDLMRARIEIKPLALELMRPNSPPMPNSTTTAFTLSFEYEDPALAMQVADEFLAEILSDDAARRTSSAAEATKFLDQEVKRLQGQHDAVVTQIEALRRRPPDETEAVSEGVKAQMKSLADLQAALVEKSAVYSDQHPVIKNLKKNIEALKRVIATAPHGALVTGRGGKQEDVATEVLEQQLTDLDKSLQDANSKLAAARLGETMEKNKQADHLRVLEQPSLPRSPVRPKKLKWFAIALGLAGMMGASCVFAAEMLDGSIRRSQQLASIVDRNMIVTIPYLYLPGEQIRTRLKYAFVCIALVAVVVTAVSSVEIKHTSIDFAGLSQYWPTKSRL